MRKIIAALALAALAFASPVAAQTGPKYGKNGGIGSSTSTYSGGEPTGGTYAINGTTGWASFGGVNFKPQSSAPSSPAEGDCWLLTGSGLYCRVGSNTVGPFSPRYAPLVADGYSGGDATTTASSTTFTAASRACVAGDAGKVIVIAGAGAANAPLKTTIASCSGSNYVLSVAASSAVSSQLWGMGTDNSGLLNTLITNNPGATIMLPPGQILMDATQITLGNIALQGAGAGSNRGAAFANPGAQGTTMLMASPTVQPFVITRGVKWSDTNFLWPGQSGIIATPVAYPPLFTDGPTIPLADFWFVRNGVMNAYDFYTQNAACGGAGTLRVLDSNIYAIRRFISACAVGETFSINGSVFNPSVWYEGTVSRPNQYLLKWSQANADWLYVFGNGNSTTCSTQIVGGLIAGAGTTINGVRRVVHVVSGILDEAVWGGDTDINGVDQIMVVEPAGFVSHVSMLGHMYPNGKPGLETGNVAFDFQGTCDAGYASDIKIGGRLIGPQASVFNVAGTNLARLMISVDAKNYGDWGSPGSPYYFATLNNPNTMVSITDSTIRASVQDSNRRGVLASQVQTLNFTGNTCERVYNCVDVSGLAANKYTTITGNVSVGTSSTYAAVGTLSASITAYGNTFDRPNPAFDALQSGQLSSNSYVATPVYYLPTANGQTYTWILGNHQLTIDSAPNSVTTATVVLPTAPADGYVVRMGASSAITTLTLTPGSGDQNKCGSGALPNGQTLACVFRKGIGPASPNGAWFTY